MELIIYLGCLGALIQHIPQYIKVLQFIKLDRKPFNCPLCFTFWASLIFTIATGNTDISTSIFISSGAAILAELLWRKLNTY